MRSKIEIVEEAAIFAETTVDALMAALTHREEPVALRAPHHKIPLDPVDQIRVPAGLRQSRFEERPTPKKTVPGRIYH